MNDQLGETRIYDLDEIAGGVIQIIGDGNCLFRAISYCVYNKEQKFFRIVRKTVVDHIVREWSKFCDYIVGQDSPEVYKEYMNTNGQNGTCVEIQAATEVYNITIQVYVGNTNNVYTIGLPNNEMIFKLLYTGDGNEGHYEVLQYENLDKMIENVYAMRRKRTNAKAYNKQKNTKPVEKDSNIGGVNNEVVNEDIIIDIEEGDGARENEGDAASLNTHTPSTVMKDCVNVMKDCVRNNVGEMSCRCTYCGALYWKGESVMKNCCHDGKIKVLPLSPYPTNLQALITEDAKFRRCIRNFNSMFAFASFANPNT